MGGVAREAADTFLADGVLVVIDALPLPRRLSWIERRCAVEKTAM